MAQTLTATVDCEECETPYTGSWPVDGDLQDMAAPPRAVQQCPSCGHQQEEEYSGWTSWTEAG